MKYLHLTTICGILSIASAFSYYWLGDTNLVGFGFFGFWILGIFFYRLNEQYEEIETLRHAIYGFTYGSEEEKNEAMSYLLKNSMLIENSKNKIANRHTIKSKL